MKMKLLFITRSFPPTFGGMENFSYGLYEELNKRIDLTLLANVRSYKGLIIFFIKVFFYTLFKSRQFDVIYTNDMLTSVAAFPAKLYGKKFVTPLYGLDINFALQKPDKLIKFMLSIPYKILIKIALKIVNVFVPISTGTQELAKSLGVDSDYVVTPAINVTAVEVSRESKQNSKHMLQQKYLLDESKSILFFIGRPIKRKGIYWFLENVMPMLANDFILLVAGSGTEEENNLLKATVKQYNLVDSVILLGRITDDDRELCYQGADIFIMPNIHIKNTWEGFGIVGIEAGSFGTPTVAANIEGVTSAIVEDKTGNFFVSGDKSNCSEIVRKVLAKNYDPKEVRDFVKKEYSFEKMGSEYIKIFNTLIVK